MNCVYDNPATMARELWDSGILTAHVTAKSLMSKANKPIGQEFFEPRMGLWKPGQWIGDNRAVKGTVFKEDVEVVE